MEYTTLNCLGVPFTATQVFNEHNEESENFLRHPVINVCTACHMYLLKLQMLNSHLINSNHRFFIQDCIHYPVKFNISHIQASLISHMSSGGSYSKLKLHSMEV